MSTPDTTPAVLPPDDPPAAELHLGRALALIHRALPRLEELDRADAVQATLRQAVAQLESACAAHGKSMEALRPAAAEGEMMAIIAAAVAVVLGRPHRVLDVQKAVPLVTWVNAWAIEGRFQHYSSHKVR